MTKIEKVERTEYVAQPTVAEQDHYIGVRLKRKDDKKPFVNGRVRIELPDGDIKEGRTNGAGEFEVKGFALAGKAKITLLDAAKPGKADPPQWSVENEFSVTLVDETGKPVPNAFLSFAINGKNSLVMTDTNGVAKHKQANLASVTVTLEPLDRLARLMRPIWSEGNKTPRKDWTKPEADKTTVVSHREGKYQQLVLSDAADANPSADKYVDFSGLKLLPSKPQTISLQPHIELVRLIGMGFDTDTSFLLPTALPSMRRIKELFEEHDGETLVIVGHADSAGSAKHNDDLASASRRGFAP